MAQPGCTPSWASGEVVHPRVGITTSPLNPKSTLVWEQCAHSGREPPAALQPPAGDDVLARAGGVTRPPAMPPLPDDDAGLVRSLDAGQGCWGGAGLCYFFVRPQVQHRHGLHQDDMSEVHQMRWLTLLWSRVGNYLPWRKPRCKAGAQGRPLGDRRRGHSAGVDL